MPAVAMVLIGFGAGMAAMAVASCYKKFYNFWKRN